MSTGPGQAGQTGQVAAPYSARSAIAAALRAYEAAEQERRWTESRAAAARDAAVKQATAARDQGVRNAETAAVTQRSNAERLFADADKLCAQADGLLRQALIAPPASHLQVSVGPATGGPDKELSAQQQEARLAFADLETALRLLERVRLTFVVKLRNRIGLPP